MAKIVFFTLLLLLSTYVFGLRVEHRTIYVGNNLSKEATQDALSALFAKYGTVKRVQIPTDRETG